MQVPSVLVDHNRHTAILVAAGPKWSVLIPCTASLGTSRIPSIELQKKWQLHDYPVGKAARSYLRSSYRTTAKAFLLLEEIVMNEMYTEEALTSMSEKELLAALLAVTGSAPARLKPKSKGIDAILLHQAGDGVLLARASKAVKAPKPVKVKAEKAPKPVKVKAEKGYKGHRAGSRKEQLHKLFDAGKHSNEVLAIQALEMGLAATTARAWFSAFAKG